MITIKSFVFNPIQVNAFVLYDESGECVLIDPAVYYPDEEVQLKEFITENSLVPVKILNTHYHFDHILGNKFISDNYNVSIEAHSSLEEFNKHFDPVKISEMFGLKIENPPRITKYLDDGDIIRFGNSKLKAIHVPGHTPQCIVYYCEEQKFIIAGDVLFDGSIGRTDLPGGEYEELIYNITTKLMTLDDDVKVFPGHGNSTTIGKERKSNPFLK
jgi:hydroxyacylglutathione hydrolase